MAFVARANPVAKLAVAALIPVALVLTVDPVTAGSALGLEILALPWCGLGPGALLRHGWIVLLGAIPAGLLTVLIGADGGIQLVAAGPVTVTEGSLLSGISITLRVLAIGLPGVVLVATTDPTDLADGLAQILRLPARFVLSALAAMRLVGVITQEWRDLSMARRARGLEAGFSVSGAKVAFGQLFALLVLTIRRATVLATAMEARGFGAVHRRSWARPSSLRWPDAVVIAGGVLIAVLCSVAGVLAGTWQLLLT